jgi:flagellar motor switch protein FliN
MTALTSDVCDQISGLIHSNRGALAESFNSALGTRYELSRGTVSAGVTKALELCPDEPGIAVTFNVDGQGLLILIPESLPVPRWYRAPNDSQSARIQTLPMEWAASLFPPDVEPSEYGSVACGNLRQQLEACQPDENIKVLELNLSSPLATTQQTRMWAVWPVANPMLTPVVTFDDLKTAAVDAPTTLTTTSQNEPERRRQRLLKVPVQMIVRIAEKKVDLRQIRGFSPGTLLTFNKPCEALLDVYIGNHLHCRGEAVKVGENFGIKINELNATQVRERKVHRV